MREVLFRVRALLSDRVVLGWWTTLASVGLGLTWLPLMGQPGYELAAGLTLVLTFLGGGLAIAAARSRPGLLASAMLLLLATLPSLLLATLRTALGTPCDPLATVEFVPLLTVPTAALVAVLGAFAARLTRRWWLALLVYFGFVLTSAVPTAWPLIAGPQVFAFNHLGGYLPGPLYDEEISVPASLLWFRLGTLGLALGVGALLQKRRLRAKTAPRADALANLRRQPDGTLTVSLLGLPPSQPRPPNPDHASGHGPRWLI